MLIKNEIAQDYRRHDDDLLSEPDLESLRYLQAHLDALRLTLGVLQQTLCTAQGIIWARYTLSATRKVPNSNECRIRPAISPQQAATAIDNEKIQLENAIVEQQIALFRASSLYEPSTRTSRLITETESELSLATITKDKVCPASLHRYQERFLASFDLSESSEKDWFPAVCGVSRAYLERLLERWTRLHQIEETIIHEEKTIERERRQSQQPTVESEEEDDPKHGPNSPLPGRVGGNGPRQCPTVPLSPASSPNTSPRSSFATPFFQAPYSPATPTLNLPTEATAAAEANDNDNAGLEIPWKLCTRKYYWSYIDNTINDSNTALPPSEAFAHRNSWTEILASWVCKEAIKEKGYSYTQVQKERQHGRRTEFETCFCIQGALTFQQVQTLVERTVEIFRTNLPPKPPPLEHAASGFNHRTLSGHEASPIPPPPRPLERSATYAYPPPPPPPPPPAVLERTSSLPGKGLPYLTIPSPNLNVPNSPSQYTGQQWASPSPNTPLRASSPTNTPPPRRSRQSSSRRDHSRASTLSDSDEAPRRRHRSRSRRSSTSSQKKKRSSTVATLAKVGALATLLDGIVELGVL